MEEVTVIDVKPQLVLGARTTGPYREIATLIGKVCRFAVESGAMIVGPPMFVCHEESAEASHEADRQGNADIEVVVPVSAAVQGSDEVRCYELPGGRMAKTVHKGPYDQCGPAYERLFAWIAASGKNPVGPTRELYLNDPNELPPSEILTEIHAPIG